jgi:hypothetical protein
VKLFLKVLGPGIITGASDDDPSGIGTYAIAGASFGLTTLWMALITLPMMSPVQFMCAKIGMVTGRGLAGVPKTHYSRPLVYATVVSLVIANSINAGADIGAIAAGINLLAPIPVWSLIVPIALSIIALQIWGSYRFTRYNTSGTLHVEGGVPCSGVCGGGFCAGGSGWGEVSRGISESRLFPGARLPLPVVPGVAGLASGLAWLFIFPFLLFLVFIFWLCEGC